MEPLRGGPAWNVERKFLTSLTKAFPHLEYSANYILYVPLSTSSDQKQVFEFEGFGGRLWIFEIKIPAAEHETM